MELLVKGHGTQLREPLLQHIERRVRLNLSRFGAAITRVSVRILDVNGPRGGEDKLCRIETRLRSRAPVIVENTAAAARESFDRAIDRVARVVERDAIRRLEPRRTARAFPSF